MEPTRSTSSSKDPSVLAELDAALADTGGVCALADARFLESHSLYEARSDQRRQIIEWFKKRVPTLVTNDAPFAVLSIGCGSGPVDVPIASFAAEPAGSLAYAGVNPNRVECDDFARAFADAQLPESEVEVAPVGFDDFETDRQFDLVHCIHSLYYMADAGAALERAHQMTAPGGKLVVLHAPRNPLNDLAARFYDKLYGRPTLFADDVETLIERARWPFEHARIHARLDVTEMFGGDPEIGLALRDFILQIDSQRLPEPIQELVERQLRRIAHEDGGRWFMGHEVDAFVIAA